jgi:hypothetical protein
MYLETQNQWLGCEPRVARRMLDQHQEAARSQPMANQPTPRKNEPVEQGGGKPNNESRDGDNRYGGEGAQHGGGASGEPGGADAEK